MKQITEIELAQVLEDHDLWRKSDGKKGKQADLSCTDLRMTEHWYSDVWGVLWATNFEHSLLPTTLKIYNTYKHIVFIHPTHTQISCEYHSNKEWHNFTDEAIEIMNPCLTGWWENNKKTIFRLMDKVEKLDKEKQS
jgi:hypothetical protein